MVKVNRFTFSHESVTCRRSPEVSSTTFNAQPPDLQPVPFDGYGLRSHVPARPAPYASDPVLVHRLASLLRASFRPRLAASVISSLRFAITSRASRCEEDFHLQTVEHARHTNKSGTNSLRAAQPNRSCYFLIACGLLISSAFVWPLAPAYI